MGEVYRARDSRLGREVAVKVIASEGSSSPDRLRRFEEEARAVAALDDPHILSIHDLGVHDGTASAVFELLEGETLRQRLERGALTPRKAVESTIQICLGLAAAHARGIVHRDLKPANLFVTREGRIKILDFGLAKLNEPVSPRAATSDATRTATEQGTLLGTVGYMSPEQVRGQPADARSDLFAVGAILYEMLSGRRAFEGATAADTISAILAKEPPQIATPGGPLPGALERVVRRCLEKDPEERFQSARDVAFALDALTATSSPGAEVALPAAPARRRFLWVAGAVTVALVSGAAGLWTGRSLWQRPLPRIQQLTFRRGLVDWARFTSDGKTIVYGAYWDGQPPEIFSTRLESRESRSLGLSPARLLAVSSQGELAILLTRPGDLDLFSTGTLARVSLSGGEPRKVLDDVWLADWSPDGRELAVLRLVEAGAFQLEYPIGHVVVRDVGRQHFRISPRGDRVAVDGPGVTVYDRAGGKVATLAVPEGAGPEGSLWTWSLAWDGDDALWVVAGEAFRSRSLWRVTLDGKAREVYRALGTIGLIHDASDGRLLVHHGFERGGVKAKPPGETEERELGVLDFSALGAMSDDGTRLLIHDQAGEGEGHTYFRLASGAPPVRLGEGYPLALSPDGKWAVLGSGPNRLKLVPTGAGLPRELPPSGYEGALFGWFIDDERVLVNFVAPGGKRRAILYETARDAPRPVTPEGTLAVYRSHSNGTLIGWNMDSGEFARFPLDGGEPRPLAGRILKPEYPLRAAAGGRSLFVTGTGVPRAVERLDLLTGRRTPWKTLLPEDPAGVVMVGGVFLTPDGEGYAYGYGRFLQDLFVIEGLRGSGPIPARLRP